MAAVDNKPLEENVSWLLIQYRKQADTCENAVDSNKYVRPMKNSLRTRTRTIPTMTQTAMLTNIRKEMIANAENGNFLMPGTWLWTWEALCFNHDRLRDPGPRGSMRTMVGEDILERDYNKGKRD